MKQKKPSFFNPAEWEIIRWDMFITIPSMIVFLTLFISYSEVVSRGVTFGNGTVTFMCAYLLTAVTTLPFALLLGVILGCPMIYGWYWFKKHFLQALIMYSHGKPYRPVRIDISSEAWR
jgi:hypothetical protein